MRDERMGRPIFYGAMITEGIVALIWASVSSYFFYYGGWKEVVSPEVVNEFMAQVDKADGKSLIQFFTAPRVVQEVCSSWLGVAGGILAILGVVAAPITSGDTAFRSARLIVADFLHMEQRTIVHRLGISVPMFACAILLLWWQMANPNGFNVLWQFFGWSNQTLAVFSLWAATVYLVRTRKCYWITLLPAIFMTCICTSFIFTSPNMMGLDAKVLPWVVAAVVLLGSTWFAMWVRKQRSRNQLRDA